MLYVSGRIRGRTVSSFFFTCVDTDVPLQLGHVSECYVAAWRDDRRLEIGFVNCISNKPPKEGTTRKRKGERYVRPQTRSTLIAKMARQGCMAVCTALTLVGATHS